jgi:hypothetical protein
MRYGDRLVEAALAWPQCMARVSAWVWCVSVCVTRVGVRRMCVVCEC